MSELFCRGPFHLWLDRHDDMQPFATCRLYETLKLLLLQHSPQLQSGFCHRTPRQGLVRIEIEDQSIWPLEIIISSIPRDAPPKPPFAPIPQAPRRNPASHTVRPFLSCRQSPRYQFLLARLRSHAFERSTDVLLRRDNAPSSVAFRQDAAASRPISPSSSPRASASSVPTPHQISCSDASAAPEHALRRWQFSSS